MNKPTERFKEVEIDGRIFRIEKYNARTGCYIIFKLAGILTPLMGKDLEPEDIVKTISQISKEDFDYYQTESLKCCYEILPGNTVAILDEHGNCCTNDPEGDMHNTALILNLTVQTLLFNLTSFFEESGLTSLLDKISLS